VDIFDHVTSLARATHSRVSKNRRGHFIPVIQLVCHDGYPRVSTLRRRHCFEINSA